MRLRLTEPVTAAAAKAAISGPANFRARAVSLAAHLDIGVLEQDLSEDPEHEKGLIGAVEIEPGEAGTDHDEDEEAVMDDSDLGR